MSSPLIVTTLADALTTIAIKDREIERLQQQNAALTAELAEANARYDRYCKGNDTEIARLRALFKDIQDYADDPEARANYGRSIAQFSLEKAATALAGAADVKHDPLCNSQIYPGFHCDCGTKNSTDEK